MSALQPGMTILLGQFQEIDHLPGPVLLTMPHVQRLPYRIEAFRPETRSALLFQWPRSGQCPRLVRQHVQVMLQFEHLLVKLLKPLAKRLRRPMRRNRLDNLFDLCPDEAAVAAQPESAIMRELEGVTLPS